MSRWIYLLLFVSSTALGTTYNSNGSQADVQAKVNLCVDGDTVTLPSGTFTWTSSVTVPGKAITIQGNTTTNSSTGACNDLTVLVDNISAQFFDCTNFTNEKALRITGITFTGGTGSGGEPILSVGGGTDPTVPYTHNVRLDHLHITGHIKRAHAIEVYSGIYGVMDHCVYDQLDTGNPQNMQNRVDNGSYPYGDIDFTLGARYGGPDFWFIEDNYVNNDSGAPYSAGYGWDAVRGSRFVLRHNKFFNLEILCHGLDSGGRMRGGRAQEIYNNEYHWDYVTTLDGIRSGTLVVHDNTFIGSKPNGFGLQTYRVFEGNDHFGAATGGNAWDYNVTESDGVTHVNGHSPYLFSSGTLTTGGVLSVTDSRKNWTPHAFANYEFSTPSNGAVAYIQDNTATTLTLYQNADSTASHTFNAGDAYEIRRVLECMDQPGLGAGDLITGDMPSPARWLNQVREGCYSWNNIYTSDSSPINFALEFNAGLGPGLVENLDYFNRAPQSGDPIYPYTPYTYPHPLVSGHRPPAPANLHITGP